MCHLLFQILLHLTVSSARGLELFRGLRDPALQLVLGLLVLVAGRGDAKTRSIRAPSCSSCVKPRPMRVPSMYVPFWDMSSM